jgi:hypothetical protein
MSKPPLPRASPQSISGQPLSWTSFECLDDVLPPLVTPDSPSRLLASIHTRSASGRLHRLRPGFSSSSLAQPAFTRGRRALLQCLGSPPTSSCGLHVQKYLHTNTPPFPRPSLPACLSHPDPPSDFVHNFPRRGTQSTTTSNRHSIASLPSRIPPPHNHFTCSKLSADFSFPTFISVVSNSWFYLQLIQEIIIAR